MHKKSFLPKIFFLTIWTAAESLSLAAGARIEVKIEDLVPGQSTFGRAEAIMRANALQDMKPQKRREYLEKHRLQVVKGPSGAFHLVDGHHLSWALLELKRRRVTNAIAPAEQLADLSKLSQEDFEKEIIARKWVWLFDEKDEPITISALAREISQLRDDPYRTVIWLLEQEGCFEEMDIPFADFVWAKWLRKQISVAGNHTDQLRDAVLKAKEIAHGETSRGLPGYVAHHSQDHHDTLRKKNIARLESLNRQPSQE